MSDLINTNRLRVSAEQAMTSPTESGTPLTDAAERECRQLEALLPLVQVSRDLGRRLAEQAAATLRMQTEAIRQMAEVAEERDVFKRRLAAAEARVRELEPWERECKPLIEYLTGGDLLCEQPVDYAKELHERLASAEARCAELEKAIKDGHVLCYSPDEYEDWCPLCEILNRDARALTELVAERDRYREALDELHGQIAQAKECESVLVSSPSLIEAMSKARAALAAGQEEEGK